MNPRFANQNGIAYQGDAEEDAVFFERDVHKQHKQHQHIQHSLRGADAASATKAASAAIVHDAADAAIVHDDDDDTSDPDTGRLSRPEYMSLFRIAREYKTNGTRPSDRESDQLSKRFKVGPDEFRQMLLEAIDMVKYTIGEGPLAEALEAAKSKPLPLAANRYHDPRMKQLVGLCFELDRRSKKDTFYLTMTAVAGLIGADRRLVSRWLKLMIKDGLIETPSGCEGRFGKATEYRIKNKQTE